MTKHLKVCIIGDGFHSKRIQKILKSKKIKFFIFKPKSKKNYKNEKLNSLYKYNVLYDQGPEYIKMHNV